MFSYVLYSDDAITMHLNWFGLGSLGVAAKDGYKRRAHPVQKQFFRAVADELQRLGVKLTPEDKTCRSAFGDIARAILESPPSGLFWRTAFTHGPRAFAQAYVDSPHVTA